MNNHSVRKILPKRLFDVIDSNPELKKILANMNWLFVDKAVQMLVAFFAGVWVIRYLGPEKYGILSYAAAFVALFGFIAKLGLDEIAVREFVRRPEKNGEILGTTMLLRLIAGIVAFGCSLLTIALVKSGDVLVYWIVGIIALGYIFQISDVIDCWFQSRVKSKYIVYIRSAVSILSGGSKIALILLHAPLIAFAWVILAESVLILSGFVFVFIRNKGKHFTLNFDYSLGKELLSDSWPLILSSVAISVYMKIDQVMIGTMLGSRDLGIYSAAVSLSEIWYYFPLIVTASVFPSILYAKNMSRDLYLSRLQMLYDAMVWISIMIALLVSFFSKNITDLLFGKEYIQSSGVLSVYVWAGIFVFTGVVSSKYWVAENLTGISLYVTCFGAILNIILNYLFIPYFGIIGSATATIISYFFTGIVFVAMFRKARVVFLMQLKTLNIFRILDYFKE